MLFVGVVTLTLYDMSAAMYSMSPQRIDFYVAMVFMESCGCWVDCYNQVNTNYSIQCAERATGVICMYADAVQSVPVIGQLTSEKEWPTVQLPVATSPYNAHTLQHVPVSLIGERGEDLYLIFVQTHLANQTDYSLATQLAEINHIWLMPGETKCFASSALLQVVQNVPLKQATSLSRQFYITNYLLTSSKCRQSSTSQLNGTTNLG